MKRFLPYIILSVIAAVIILVVTGKKKNAGERKLNEKVTFKKEDKIPYGTFVAYSGLPYLFPGTPVMTDKSKPGYWDSLTLFGKNQLLLIISPQFFPDENEMEKLLRFTRSGNTVFISTLSLSYSAQEVLGCTVSDRSMPTTSDQDMDQLSLKLSGLPYRSVPDTFSYPGKKGIAWFYQYDTAVSQVMGTYINGYPNFLRFRAGKGEIYLQISPYAFTNYFLLHKDNMQYYDHVLSAIRPDSLTRVVWDEYFLAKRYMAQDYFDMDRNSREKRKGWFATLMEEDAFRAAFWTALVLLLVYVLIEMRRKQRYIPVIQKPKNDSLDFVKTIGRLYYQKNDHKNLVHKMTAYFLEHIRTQYKIPTNRLDDNFIKVLHHKSGYEEGEIKYLVNFMQSFSDMPGISDSQLAQFHRKLEEFYKKT